MLFVPFASFFKAYVKGHDRRLKDGRTVSVRPYNTRTTARPDAPDLFGGDASPQPKRTVDDAKILFIRSRPRRALPDDLTGDLFSYQPKPPPAPRHIGELPYEDLVARGARIANELVPGFETAWAKAELRDKAERDKLGADISRIEGERKEHYNTVLKPLFERASQRSGEVIRALPPDHTEEDIVAACDRDPECVAIKEQVDRERDVRERLFREVQDLHKRQAEGRSTLALVKKLRTAMQARVREMARPYQIAAIYDNLTVGKGATHNGVILAPLVAAEKKIVRAAVKDYFNTLGIFRTGPGFLEHVGLVVDSSGQPVKRAHAGLRTGTLNVGAPLTETNIFHELAHFYEHDYPEVRAAAHTFLKARRTSPELKPLRDLMKNPAFAASELAFEDHFVHPYIGKSYGEAGVTEVVSMGFERFATPEAMTAFYRQDPEHFLFCLAINNWLKERHNV